MDVPLVQKYKIERNAEPFPPHEGEWFVLKPAQDPAAYAAMEAYAAHVEATNATLAAGIYGWLEAINASKEVKV